MTREVDDSGIGNESDVNEFAYKVWIRIAFSLLVATKEFADVSGGDPFFGNFEAIAFL